MIAMVDDVCDIFIKRACLDAKNFKFFLLSQENVVPLQRI